MKRFKLLTFTFLLAISFTNFANARDSMDATKAPATTEARKSKKDVKDESLSVETKWDNLIQRQRAFYRKIVELLTPKKQKISSTECTPFVGPGLGYGEMKLNKELYESFTPEQIASLKKELGPCLVLPESATTAALASDTNTGLASTGARSIHGSK